MICDCNAILFSHKRLSDLLGTRNKDSAFGSLGQDLGLVDISLSGSCITWSKGTSTDTFFGACIDSAICIVEWRMVFPNASLQHLPLT